MSGLIWVLAVIAALYVIYKIAVSTFMWIIRPLIEYMENRDGDDRDEK